MRRALEELDPEVETFSAAGYFGVAVDYQGIDDPQGAAFCPVVVKPRHAVLEQPKAEDSALHESRSPPHLAGIFRSMVKNDQPAFFQWLIFIRSAK